MHVPYFESADFKSIICFQNFRDLIPKCERFGSKSINFLILTKNFFIYSNSTVVISNVVFKQKSTNMGIIISNESTDLEEILLWCRFQAWNFFIKINLERLNNRITQLRHFWNWNSLFFTWNFITSLTKINYFVFWFYLFN